MRYFLEIISMVLLVTTFVGAQRLGDLCVVADTVQPGVCRHFLNCTGAFEAAKQGKSPQVCASPEKTLVVCCPWVPGQETGLDATYQADATIPKEGDNCTMADTGRAGVCSRFANCQTAREAAFKGILPQKCDKTDNEGELVCCTKAACPPLPKGLVTQLPIGSKAADYCIELAEKIHPCQETPSGWTRGNMCPLLTPDSNIEYHRTHMEDTSDAPYYGKIGESKNGNIEWRGVPVSLVSNRWVLSTAYAIEWIGPKKIHVVGLGGTFKPSYNPDEKYGVSKIYIHPRYNKTYSIMYNDIALLLLDREVVFTSRILPVCLHTGTSLPKSGFILTGWDDGSTEYKTTMQRLNQSECSKLFPIDSTYHPAGVKHDMKFCSRPVDTAEACPYFHNGDQMTLPNSHMVACTHLLVGLGSWRNHTLRTHTNTRISPFIPWIEGLVWPASGNNTASSKAGMMGRYCVCKA